jgi:acyl-CoA synthetase (AMP-forming)/AMP-acid ligase II
MPSTPPFTFQELMLERANDAATRDRPMARHDARVVTYGEYARVATRWAHLIRAHAAPGAERPKLAVVMQNQLEYLFAYGGAALAGATLFGVNTGLGGDVLRGVIERSGASLVVVDDANRAAIEAVRGALEKTGARILPLSDVEAELAGLAAKLGGAFDEPPDAPGADMLTPWMVIYTSGTTGLPKGIINNHAKLRGIGVFVSQLVGLGPDDVGYVSMPLFHSNAVFLNWIPAFVAGASVALRERFTASGFVDDVFGYGATYWNYVGQPVHYVLEAIGRAAGGDEERVRREVTENPKNKMRLAIGTGASGAERERFKRVLGLGHVYENYGSTEAEITTWCMPADPPESVGEVLDDAILILNEQGGACPLLEVDAAGNPKNYRAAVGEIVRRGVTGRFQGYHDMPEATEKKVQEGLYRSGDLGAIREIDGHRYLYFIGRTDDWIRKDGENFSAESVVEMVKHAPGVDRAAAYGVPHPVSDEWVMVALKMKPGARFDARAFFDHCEAEVARGRDRKWFPDLVRVVDDFPWTETNKIKVRELKRDFYRPDRAPRVFMRRRGDASFEPLTRDGFEDLKREFSKTGRSELLAL